MVQCYDYYCTAGNTILLETTCQFIHSMGHLSNNFDTFVRHIESPYLKIQLLTVCPQDMWLGLLHHVIGEHEWSLDSCDHGPLGETRVTCHHGPLEDSRDKDWMEADGLAHQRLREIVLDARWLKNIDKYLHFR